MTLEAFISNAQKLDANQIIIEAAAQNLNELADLNVGQLEKGLKSDNSEIRPEYSSTAYARYKKSIGSKSSPTPDLKLTGSFHSGIFAKIESDKIKFGSDDSKEGKLQTHYSDKIFGVTDNNLINQIDSDVVKIIDKILMT